MQSYAALDRFIKGLMAAGYRFVLKDFVGFLSWVPDLGKVLNPYTRHASSFCCYAKSKTSVFHQCIQCVNILQWRSRRIQKPFWTTCVNGVEEYHLPILSCGVPIGVISVGGFCTDPTKFHQSLEVLVNRYGMDEEILRITFHESLLQASADETYLNSMFGFMMEYIATVCAPHVASNQISFAYEAPPSTSFAKIHKYILHNYTDPSISIATIANACNYSVSSVSHIFHANMQINIRDFINQLRIAMSKKLLHKGLRVADVALECGFNDPSYFSSTFKRNVGMLPLDYRKTCLFGDAATPDDLTESVHPAKGRKRKTQ